MSRVIRVFPRRTNATPVDDLVRVNAPPGLGDEADEVHISVAFTWDMERAERLAYLWEPIAPVRIGGPATGEPAGEFIPGRYLKPGHVITSRGCPNRCGHCLVWRREPRPIELPIRDGWIVHDDNLLACSPDHIDSVFRMLARQPGRARFVGGLEPSRVTAGIAERLRELKPVTLFLAYDTPDDWDPLVRAVKKLFAAGFTAASNRIRCYVLVGRRSDTLDAAETRLQQTRAIGCMPQAMYYRSPKWKPEQKIPPRWAALCKLWSRPAYTARGSIRPPANCNQQELF